MSSKVCVVVFTLLLTTTAFAQLDSSALRVKFGSPLNRETFHLPEGFDMVVDYGPGNAVCKLQVPALMPAKEQDKVVNLDVQKQQMYAFLEKVVPLSMRGANLKSFAIITGTVSLISTEYEHVSIGELQQGGPWESNNRITVTFKSTDCH